MVVMIYASPTARKTAQADDIDLDNSTTSATDSEGAACPHGFYVRNTFIECCESDGEVGSARCRASSAPAERSRQNGNAMGTAGDAFEAQQKLEAAFQEAQELKDLIREADAERDTLHDQLKQMKPGSYNFRLPEGVDEMIGAVTELTQKLDAASMDLQSARDYYNHVKLRIGLKKECLREEINEKAEERDRLKAECREVKDQVDRLQHECSRLHQELKDSKDVTTDEGRRKPEQPPELKEAGAMGASREALPFQVPEAKAKGGRRKCKRGTGHHQQSNKASRDDYLGVGASEASQLQEILSCQRDEHNQQSMHMHRPLLAADSSDIPRLDACEQIAPADNLKFEQLQQMRDTTSDISLPAASEQDESKLQELERPSQCTAGILDFAPGRDEGEQHELHSPSQHPAGTSLFDAGEQDQSKLELDKIGRSDISSLDDCEQDKIKREELGMSSRDAAGVSDIFGTESFELAKSRGQELVWPHEDAAGMSDSSKQQVMDEPGQDMAGLSGTHGCAEESGPPLLPPAASIALESDQETWQAAGIPAEETSGSRAQVRASRKEVEPLGEVAEQFKAASAHKQAVLSKGTKKSKGKGKALTPPGQSSTLGATKRGKGKAKEPEGAPSSRKRQPAKPKKSSEATEIEVKAEAVWNPMKKLFLVSILVVALLVILAAVRPALL
ncbi:unnamed protein product [Symbiodinium sp. CCMP2456]|nr:unnamed protein product [Symbiodinium sp. CCMP2456]